jgi:hypothetical protein
MALQIRICNAKYTYTNVGHNLFGRFLLKRSNAFLMQDSFLIIGRKIAATHGR